MNKIMLLTLYCCSGGLRQWLCGAGAIVKRWPLVENHRVQRNSVLQLIGFCACTNLRVIVTSPPKILDQQD